MTRSAPPAVRLPESREKINSARKIATPIDHNAWRIRSLATLSRACRAGRRSCGLREAAGRFGVGITRRPFWRESVYHYVIIINAFLLFDNKNLSSVAKKDIRAGDKLSGGV